jgi:uncharacterized protein YuzE
MEYNYHYDVENDILAIYLSERSVKESVEISENIVIDLNHNDQVCGIEIFDASEFFSAFNEDINKDLLSKLNFAAINYKSFRNQWILVVKLISNGREFSQPMPPLRKSEFVSPILAQ